MNARERIALRTKRLRQRWLLFFWRQARKIVMGVIGGTVLLIGIAGLVLPILPGWMLIFVGLGILATEFAWARWVLKSAKDRLAALMSQSESQMPEAVTQADPKDKSPSESPQIPIDLSFPIDKM